MAGSVFGDDLGGVGKQTAGAPIPDIGEVECELTFDPPWTPDRMSDDAKFILGFG